MCVSTQKKRGGLGQTRTSLYQLTAKRKASAGATNRLGYLPIPISAVAIHQVRSPTFDLHASNFEAATFSRKILAAACNASSLRCPANSSASSLFTVVCRDSTWRWEKVGRKKWQVYYVEDHSLASGRESQHAQSDSVQYQMPESWTLYHVTNQRMYVVNWQQRWGWYPQINFKSTS